LAQGGLLILDLGKNFSKDFCIEKDSLSFYTVKKLECWKSWQTCKPLCLFLFILLAEKKMWDVGGKANRRWEGRGYTGVEKIFKR